MKHRDIGFEFIVNSGNADMQDGDHRFVVASLLRGAAAQIEQGRDHRILRDTNGNNVGHWTLTVRNEDGDEE